MLLFSILNHNVLDFECRCSRVELTFPWKWWRTKEKHYLESPKSVTLTVPFPSTKQFLAACATVTTKPKPSIRMYFSGITGQRFYAWHFHPKNADSAERDVALSCASHQISVDVLVGLQIGHALRDVFAHLQQLDGGWVLLQSLSQVCQQAAVGKELGHNINGPLFGANAVQLHQVLVAKIPGVEKSRVELISLPGVIENSVKRVKCGLQTYIMILASSMNSSSDMEPSLIILMATSCFPCHLPYFTTPNCPVPKSLMKVR